MAIIMQHRFKLIAFIFLTYLASLLHASTPNNNNNVNGDGTGIVLRIRLGDGSIERVQIPADGDSQQSMTLKQVLSSFSVEDGSSVQIGSITKSINDDKTPLSSLGLKHGSLLTIMRPKTTKINKPTESKFSHLKKEKQEFQPFPDLAKDYTHAYLKSKSRRSGGSYNAIANIQSEMHIVEPQQEGPLKRVYMCRYSAERFQVNGIQKKTGQVSNKSRAGLLFGTIQRERVEQRPKRAKTSLSSQTSDAEYCTVAKVQALWEPQVSASTSTRSNNYDVDALLKGTSRVIEIANQLGLVPVGWIFTYLDNRHEDEDALPIYGIDVQTGATLQIENMKSRGHEDGMKFVTLAMDAKTGATEAFQLSDVSVQMVSEGMLLLTNEKSGRYVPSKHEIIVDGRETKQLDSVLCLINTAMLSHVGYFAGSSATSSVKKNGTLTKKTKQALLKAMEQTKDDGGDKLLLQELCDLNTIVALDQMSISKNDINTICQQVRKWARGQKQGASIPSKIKLKLKALLDI